MTFAQISITAVILVILLLFVWGKLRYDIVALLGLGVAVALGIVPADQMFSGFGHPATITVAIVLALSFGLTKSGAVEHIAHLVDPLADSPTLHTTALVFIAGILSMFMNNVGALALIMLVAIQSTLKAGRSPATILIPLSFGSILGGLATLIGTPPNIIISVYREELTGTPFKMFDFSPVGGTVALIGIAFIVLLGWKLVKTRKSNAGLNLFEIESYLFEVKITENCELIGKTKHDIDIITQDYDINIASVLHGRHYRPVTPSTYTFDKNDLLILEGSQEQIDKFVSKYKLDMVGADNAREKILHSAHTLTMEVVVAPGSRIAGRTVANIRFHTYYDVNLLAISRKGKANRGRLKTYKIQIGDVLLLHGEKEMLQVAISKLGCYPLADQGFYFGKRKFAWLALIIFAIAIMTSVLGLFPLQLSLGAAVLAMVLLDIIPLRELYENIDWPVIVLLGGMIPIGAALQSSGTTQLIVDGILSIASNVPIFMLLSILLIVTMTLSDILNNAATTILMAPISASIANALGVSVDPFLMAVALGASCAFLTPIGHQNNALIMGPGGYQFGDYWRIGLPLEIIIVLVSIPLILWFWPL